MALYSFKGANPTTLPNRLKLSDGTTRTDKTTFTDEMIADAGWILVEDPPEVTYPNKLEWNSSTMQWVVRPPNDAEIAFRWQEIQNWCQERLTQTDYKVIKAVELGEEVDASIKNYRQALRDLYNNVNDADPWTVQYPVIVVEGPVIEDGSGDVSA